MDVSPKTLREVEFREKLRGYHPEDVDEFLEKIAAGIEALQERLRQTTERAVHAEQLASESGVNDEAIRRTLVLAQRTADMAVQEAKEQATAIVDEARGRAAGIVADARAEMAELAREAQAELRSDLERLTTARDQLREEVAALEAWVQEHRTSLSASMRDALDRLEHGLTAKDAPEPVELDIPAAPELALTDAGGRDEPPVADGADVAVLGTEANGDTDDDGKDSDGDDSDTHDSDTHDSDTHDNGVDSAAPDPIGDALAPDADGGLRVDDSDATGEYDVLVQSDASHHHDSDSDSSGEPGGDHERDPEQPDDQEDGGHGDDDPFMAELRRAVTDDEPLGPRDNDEPLPVPHEREFEEGPEGRRFGGRRRRRR